MFPVITNIYNKKTPNAYTEPSTLLFSTSIAPSLQVPLISSDYAEKWPKPVQRHLQRLMGDHLTSACTDTQFAICTKCTLHSNHRFTRVIFQHTILLPRSGHFLTTYIRIAQRQKGELRWKTTYWGKKMSCSFYLYRFRKYVSYGFPIKIFCNPGVHYETPCIKIHWLVFHIKCLINSNMLKLGRIITSWR
jgi:hypothetical protein